MKQTAVQWLRDIYKERELDKFDWEKALEIESEIWHKMKFKSIWIDDNGKVMALHPAEESKIPELSDEEIDDAASSYSAVNSINGLNVNEKYADFTYACKWYRELIKSKQ